MRNESLQIQVKTNALIGTTAMKNKLIGYSEARATTIGAIEPLGTVTIPLFEGLDDVVAEDLYAKVNSPSVDASMKDGYAVRSEEIENATAEHPVALEIIGSAAAGVKCDQAVRPGTAVRILTGAKIPEGANAVVAEEFTSAEGQQVRVTNTAEPGRNILLAGSDVALGERMCAKGDRLVPGMVGILAAAGYGDIPVYCRPSVAIIATGDEVVVPGRPLAEGKLYASNLVTLNAWCRRYGMNTALNIVNDKPDIILKTLKDAVEAHDAVLTSGGAWTGDRDFVVRMLETLGWKQFFHRIRIGPGKAVGFGLLNEKPVFILPGGPPSNLLAFLQIGLPGLMKLGGYKQPKLPEVKVLLDETVTVRDVDWTQFIFGRFVDGDGYTRFRPLKLKSRLQSMAKAEAMIAVPEGAGEVEAGAIVSAQLLV